MAFQRDKAKTGTGGFKRDKAAPAVKPQAEGLLYDIPGIGKYIRSADEFMEPIVGPMKTPQELQQMSGDVARVGIDAAGLGAADYLAGGNQAQLTQEARDRLGIAALPVDIGAGFFTPTGVPAKAGRVLQTVGHGISGGAQNIANEWTHGERDPWDLAKAGAVGSGLSAAGSAIMDPIASLFSRRKAVKELPPTESLKTEGKAGYEDVKSKGGVYHRDDVRKLLAEFNNMNLAPGVDDRAIALRNWLDKSWGGQDVPPDKLDQMRRIIRGKMKTSSGADRILGEDFVKGMDKFADRNPVGDASGAAIPGVNETLKAARSRYAQYYKARDVDKAAPIKKGLFNVYGEGSDIPAVKRFEGIKKKIDEKGGAGYTPAEQKGVAKAAAGSPLRDIGEMARQYSPLRNINTAISSAATIPFIGPWALTGMGVAEGLSALGKSRTQADINDLQSIIKTGKGIAADPVAVAALKDKFARMMTAATRTGYNQFGGPR